MSKERIWFETIDGSVIDNYDMAKVLFIVSGIRVDPNDEFIKEYAEICDGIKGIKQDRTRRVRNENTCVMCGETIPEGKQVCPLCYAALYAAKGR